MFEIDVWNLLGWKLEKCGIDAYHFVTNGNVMTIASKQAFAIQRDVRKTRARVSATGEYVVRGPYRLDVVEALRNKSSVVDFSPNCLDKISGGGSIRL